MGLQRVRHDWVSFTFIPGKDSANEKSWTLHLICPPKCFFLSIKAFSFTYPVGTCMLVHHGCRKLNCNSLLILNKPVSFFGWRNNWKSIWLRSLFWWPVWGPEKTQQLWWANRCLYPQAEPVCSLIFWLTLEFEGTPRSCPLCIWTLSRLYSGSS